MSLSLLVLIPFAHALGLDAVKEALGMIREDILRCSHPTTLQDLISINFMLNIDVDLTIESTHEYIVAFRRLEGGVCEPLSRIGTIGLAEIAQLLSDGCQRGSTDSSVRFGVRKTEEQDLLISHLPDPVCGDRLVNYAIHYQSAAFLERLGSDDLPSFSQAFAVGPIRNERTLALWDRYVLDTEEERTPNPFLRGLSPRQQTLLIRAVNNGILGIAAALEWRGLPHLARRKLKYHASESETERICDSIKRTLAASRPIRQLQRVTSELTYVPSLELLTQQLFRNQLDAAAGALDLEFATKKFHSLSDSPEPSNIPLQAWSSYLKSGATGPEVMQTFRRLTALRDSGFHGAEEIPDPLQYSIIDAGAAHSRLSTDATILDVFATVIRNSKLCLGEYLPQSVLLVYHRFFEPLDVPLFEDAEPEIVELFPGHKVSRISHPAVHNIGRVSHAISEHRINGEQYFHADGCSVKVRKDPIVTGSPARVFLTNGGKSLVVHTKGSIIILDERDLLARRLGDNLPHIESLSLVRDSDSGDSLLRIITKDKTGRVAMYAGKERSLFATPAFRHGDEYAAKVSEEFQRNFTANYNKYSVTRFINEEQPVSEIERVPRPEETVNFQELTLHAIGNQMFIDSLGQDSASVVSQSTLYFKSPMGLILNMGGISYLIHPK